MPYEPTATSAIKFAQADSLEAWIHQFLCNEGNNKPFSDGLKLVERRYLAPALMPLNQFQRCCGPESHMAFRTPADSFHAHVAAIAQKYASGDWDMPPLIVQHNNGIYTLNDGNHRFEALKRLNIDRYWVIIWETV